MLILPLVFNRADRMGGMMIPVVKFERIEQASFIFSVAVQVPSPPPFVVFSVKLKY